MANDRFLTLVLGTLLAVLAGWIFHVARDIFIPIVFAVMVVYVVIGTNRWLARIPVLGPALPPTARHVVVAVVIGAVLGVLGWLVMGSIDQMIARAGHYQSSLVSLVQRYAAFAGMDSEPTWESIRGAVLAQVNLPRLATGMALSVTSVFASLIVVALYVVFLLIERRHLGRKIEYIAKDPDRVAKARQTITHINDRVGAYLALKTLLSVLLGFVSWVILAAFGVEFAVFWALLIGMLNYVPYIGSVLGVLVPAVFGLLQFGDIGTVILLALALSVVQFLNGNILDPLLMGSSLNLSPFVILASLAAWTAIWGIPGAFLAVPITASLVMVLAQFDVTRPIAILLSRDGKA